MKAAKPKRRVRIVKGVSCWFVEYVDRRPRQRHFAAQFYLPQFDRAYVERYVRGHDRLELVEEPAEADIYVTVRRIGFAHGPDVELRRMAGKGDAPALYSVRHGKYQESELSEAEATLALGKAVMLAIKCEELGAKVVCALQNP